MRYAIYVPGFGPSFGDPSVLVSLAVEAEAAGWDGFFLWDHVVVPGEPVVADVWVTLGAVAARTSRVRLGPLVTSLGRRRPWKVALEASTLQRLSGGRLVLGVGAGVPQDFSPSASGCRVRRRCRRGWVWCGRCCRVWRWSTGVRCSRCRGCGSRRWRCRSGWGGCVAAVGAVPCGGARGGGGAGDVRAGGVGRALPC
ncbi:LLM class flavin-dependent oxidoreductase [Lentzea albida]|uniref:LLM class flavin-dependent oxidoreductase n=1 Tax=Lentzea albida TaxID=65499 RepID=UPI000B7D082F